MEQSDQQRNTRSAAPNGVQRLSLANDQAAQPRDLQALPAGAPAARSASKIPTFIVWSVFNLLMLPFGILCCYFSHKVSHFKIQNRYEMAIKWSKRTFVLNTVTTLLMAGIIITVVMLRYDYNQRHDDQGLNITRTTGAYIPWQPGR